MVGARATHSAQICTALSAECTLTAVHRVCATLPGLTPVQALIIKQLVAMLIIDPAPYHATQGLITHTALPGCALTALRVHTLTAHRALRVLRE